MIPILLDSTKTIQQLVNDKTNGIGRLTRCVRCEVTEERNGSYTLELDYPVEGDHFSDIKPGGVIRVRANPDDPLQLFRIQKISKPMKGNITIFANHISYDLTKVSVLPFDSNGAAATFAQIKSKMIGGNDFSLFTDITNSTSLFSNDKPQSFRALMGGQEGSMIDIFGGELKWDNNKVSLFANRGKDNGLTIAYGKNLTDINQEENIESMYTAVLPYIIDSNQKAIVGDLQTIISTDEPKILNLDLSSEFQNTNENGEDVPPTKEEINAKAQEYILKNDLVSPKVSISVSFVDLSQFDEFKEVLPLLKLGLCDTVKVKFDKLGVSASAKMIKYIYDSLLERYVSIEIGDAKSTLEGTIVAIPEESKSQIEQAAGFLDGTISAFTGIIANGLGLFVTRKPVGTDGGYQIYLHNKPTLAESQYQWTINASGFAVSKDYGKTWSAGFTADGDAVFNSLSANAIYALSIFGSVITFGDPGGVNVVASTTPDNAGIQFTGSGKINFNTSGEFRAENRGTSNILANQILMYRSSNNSLFYLTNRSMTDQDANKVSLISQGDWNAIRLDNNDEGNEANSIQLSTAGSKSDINLWNYIPGTKNAANSFVMGCDGGNTFLNITNYDSNGNQKCGIYFKENGTFTISSNTGGTSQVYTDTGGNLTVFGNNSLNLVSQNYYVVIHSGGVARRCVWKTINGEMILCGEV